MSVLQETETLIQNYQLIDRSKETLRRELMSLSEEDLKVLLNQSYSKEELCRISTQAVLVTYGLDYHVLSDTERIKLSFDLLDFEGDQVAIYYCFYDMQGNLLDGFFDPMLR